MVDEDGCWADGLCELSEDDEARERELVKLKVIHLSCLLSVIYGEAIEVKLLYYVVMRGIETISRARRDTGRRKSWAGGSHIFTLYKRRELGFTHGPPSPLQLQACVSSGPSPPYVGVPIAINIARVDH